MNERIKELSKRALDWCDENISERFSKEFGEAWEQKFAELIIRECADVADVNFDSGSCPAGYGIIRHFGLDDNDHQQ